MLDVPSIDNINLLGDRNPKILLVDDSPYNLFVLKELIESLHTKLETERAMNGEEAICKVKEACLNRAPFE